MKILIAGGSGFIGRYIEKHFHDQGHSVNILTRKTKGKNDVLWDGKSLGSWKETLVDTDVLINLTGKSVDCRYTKSNKAEILCSRLDSTAIHNEVLRSEKNKVKLFINASSATIYDHSLERINTEKNGIIGDDFSMNVVKSWEEELFKNVDNIRRVAMRMSIVMGADGGAYPKIKMITKLGLGGHQGDGFQKVSWIHIDDLMRAVHHIVQHQELAGPIYVTSPHPVTNRKLMSAIRKSQDISFGICQPKWLLEVGSFFLRTETELLLKSRNVYPQELVDSGFVFQYNTIDSCMTNLAIT